MKDIECVAWGSNGVAGLVQRSGNPVFEGWHCRQRGNMEESREGDNGETDSIKVRVAFGKTVWAARLASKRISEASIEKEVVWLSDVFMVYVGANMENPVWASGMRGDGR